MADHNTFTILGSSAGMPQAGRANSGYVLKTGDELTLFDCGGGICSSFLRFGFDPLAVQQIFISHTHPDHCSDLPLFIQMIYLSGREEPLSLYLPEEFVKPFAEYMKAVYLIREKLPFEINLIGYGDGFTFESGFIVEAIGNSHLAGYQKMVKQLKLPNRQQCHSFLISTDKSRLLYSADIGNLNDISKQLDDLKYGVIEATHIDLEELLKLSNSVSVDQFIITHLGSDTEIDHIRSLINNDNLKNFLIAEDGMILDL